MSLPNELMPVGLFGTGAVSTGYSISRSLRFNSPDSAYLSRTPASSGNRKTWTWAGWVKRSSTDSDGAIIFSSSPSAGANTYICFAGSNSTATAADGISFFSAPLGVNVGTAGVFRDFSAWFHLVVAVDTTQGTAANRVKIYINGTEAAYASTTYPTSSQDLGINAAFSHTIGTTNSLDGWAYFSGYLADIHFIDGQALTPTSFGEFDTTTGVWNPKAYTGTYGTNGFRLDFSDNSAATATTLGKDRAGSNNWTPNNLSVTAGAGNDSLVDVPTNGAQTDTGVGGEVRGNYATLNPLNKGTSINLSNGNLDYSQASTSTNNRCISTIYVSGGKWYIEHTVNTTNAGMVIGIASASEPPSSNYFGSTSKSYGYAANGLKYNNGSGSSYGATFGTVGDIIGIAYNADAGTLTYYKNGVSQGTAFTGIPADSYYFGQGNNSEGYSGSFNFGQRPFAYTAPSGFKALNTANLPAPVVTKPSTVMDVALYTGNNTARSITGLGFSPDFVWIKGRSGATDHALYDAVRGVQKDLVSNSTAAETTQTTGLTAFNSDGFSIGTLAKLNTNAATYAGWCWDAGSSTVTNTQGSISSQVRANASAGFSVVTYTGTGANATVGHGLGIAPQFFVFKRRNSAQNWAAYHASIANMSQGYLYFNSTHAFTSGYTAVWNSIAPTSTTISIGTDAEVNANTGTYVAYCFAPVAGYSAFGSYTGNGSADGPFVFTGMLPRWLLLKRTSSTGNWNLFDTSRSNANLVNKYLLPNDPGGEFTFSFGDILSNGFKLRDTSVDWNGSGSTIVYAAFAEHPFQYSRAR